MSTVNSPVAPSSDSSAAPRANATDYSDVLLLINNQSMISMQVGNYFKNKRKVPDANVCNISMPTSEWIDTTQFQTVRTAVERFINASGLNSTLNYIVTTKGCPLGVWENNNRYASFMDELGLILGQYSAAIGNQYWLVNPFGGSEERFSRQKVGIFIVTRIDGYDLADCRRLVDNAFNSTGARGTFVLDSQPWKDGSGYQDGNDWCRAANKTLTGKGWTVYLDDTPWYVVNQKNVSGYCSWGSNDFNNPSDALTNFTWVPGAIGSTYVSTSARSFSYPPSYPQSLIADLIREGITGVHGNVAEPYLTACARPQYFLERYTRGWNLGESFYAGMATQSWQNCVIGDPKIEPYSNQPDPAVFGVDMAYSEPSLVEGMTINITAKVRNLGGGAAYNTTAAFYNGNPRQGGKQIGQNLTIELIPAGGNITIQVPWDLAKLYGSLVAYVCITASNITPQLWDGNDIAWRNATIFTRPDLVVPREKFTVSMLSPLEGDQVWVNATVRNQGGFMAASRLRFRVDDIVLSERDISLMGGEETRQGIVWSSEGFPGAHQFTVEAVPVPYESELSNNNVTSDIFVRRFGLSLSSDLSQQACLPGRNAVFNITLRSLANTAEAVTLRLSPSPDFWSGTVEPERVQLDGGASSNNTVTVTAPEPGLVTDRWDLQVRCEGLTSGMLRELNLSVSVLPVRSLQISCDPEEGSARPGENASFKLNVRNLGNGPDTVNLSFIAPEGWQVSFESQLLELAHKGSAAVLVKVSPPAGALAGERQQITLAATSLDGANYTANVTVEAEQTHYIASYAGTEVITLAPGDEESTVFHVFNHGNGEDTVKLSVQPGELSVSLSAQSLTLAAFSGENVTLRVKVPEKYAGTEEKLKIVVEPAHSPRIYLELTVNVVRPDLSVPKEAVKVAPAAPVEGAPVTISVEVRNGGTAGSGPVAVRLLEFNVVVENFTIDDLAPGGRATVVFAWTPAASGVHELKISAECGYRDLSPGDNSAAVAVSVAPKKVNRPGPAGDAGLSTTIIAGGVILAGATLALAAFFLLRRKPPEPAEAAGPKPDGRAGFSLVSGEPGGSPPTS
jgi:uncharacterized protein (TIGR03790 family)